METEIITAVSSLGAGGVIGVIIFWMYRQDRRCSEDRLTKLLEADQQSREESTKATAEHTSMIAELLAFLRAKNGHEEKDGG
jgi:hypothetical protein